MNSGMCVMSSRPQGNLGKGKVGSPVSQVKKLNLKEIKWGPPIIELTNDTVDNENAGLWQSNGWFSPVHLWGFEQN